MVNAIISSEVIDVLAIIIVDGKRRREESEPSHFEHVL